MQSSPSDLLRSAAAIRFGRRRIGVGQPVAVIAEIGINHEGDASVCAAMIEAAARAGADAIKLQTMDPDQNYMRGSESYLLFSRAVLSREDTAAMFDFARFLGMEAFTTAGDAPTIDWIERLEPAAHKISSGLLTNVPALQHAARTGRTILMSTGMADSAEIDEAVAAAREAGAMELGLFQCTSLYPTAREYLNLGAMRWMEARYRAPVGFSDHSVGTSAAALAVAAGACMIEKHFTLDTKRPGFDHHISLDQAGMAELVRGVRDAHVVLGSYAKTLTQQERGQAPRFRRIIVAGRDIAAGETFEESNLALKRPLPGMSGLAPRDWGKVLGRRAPLALRCDDPVPVHVLEA